MPSPKHLSVTIAQSPVPGQPTNQGSSDMIDGQVKGSSDAVTPTQNMALQQLLNQYAAIQANLEKINVSS